MLLLFCFSYHQKIPDNPRIPEKKATYGLAVPEVCHLPPPLPFWETAFDGKEPSQLPKTSL